MPNPASLLKLTTLDRVLLRQGIVETRLYGAWEDWAYFLAYEPDGRLKVANSIGHTRIYAWDQLESIEKRVPITVQALTEQSFLQCLRTNGGRCGAYVPDYAPAEVLMGCENLRGHLDSFHIRHADGREFSNADEAIIHRDDMRRLRAMVNRGVMPVSFGKRGRGADAKGQAGLDARRAKKVVTQFLAAALSGKKASTEPDLRRS
jgi:hypothetical protein